jgi:hypothetical protein
MRFASLLGAARNCIRRSPGTAAVLYARLQGFGSRSHVRGSTAGSRFAPAVMARAGRPDAVIARLNDEVNKAVGNADLVSRVKREGGTVLGGCPAQLADQLAKDLAKWKRVVAEANIMIQ